MGVIDDYLEELGDSQRAQLERICRIVLDRVPDAEEGRSYGLPAFRYKRKPLLGFAALKDHLNAMKRGLLGGNLRIVTSGAPRGGPLPCCTQGWTYRATG